MASYNKVLLMGNLTRDPQLRFLPTNNTALVEFGLACNRRFKTQQGEDRDEVTFVDCSAFGRTAEVINQYFQKGKPIFIEGRLKYDQWDDKNGGGKRSKLTVVVDNFQFIGAPQGGGGGAGGQSAPPQEYEGGGGGAPPARQAPPPRRAAPAAPQNQQAPEPPISEERHFGESDIPF